MPSNSTATSSSSTERRSEAQEAREGLFRIAEWRWGEARVARGREATNAGATPSQSAPPSQPPPSAPGTSSGGQRVYNVANNPPPQPTSGYFPEQQQAGAAPGKLPQIIEREHGQPGEDLPPFRPRFKIAKFAANALSGLGWITLLAGIGAVVAGRRRRHMPSSRHSRCSDCPSASCSADRL